MLNTTSNTAAQSHNIANVLLSAKWEDVKDDVRGKVFTSDHFAAGWDTIYVNPSSLREAMVKKGMRKLTSPTLLLSSKEAKMAMILASAESPVYIQNDYQQDKAFGFIMAFRLDPVMSAEYMFYCCKYDKWSRFLSNRIDADDYCVSWKSVGYAGTDPQHGDVYITPEDIVRSLGIIRFHSIPEQNQVVEAAKSEERKVSIKAQEYSVASIVQRYSTIAWTHGIAPNYGFGLLRECYILAAGPFANEKALQILTNEPFIKDVLSQAELEYLSEHLDEVFQAIISSNDISYQSSFGFIQPQEVTDFITNIAAFPKEAVVYNPFAGANSYAISLPNTIDGEEISEISWALGQIRLYAFGAQPRSDIKLGDSFESISDGKKYSAIISSPAYLKDKGKEIGDIVSQLYDKLDANGTLACIVTANFLFSLKNKAFRKKIIEGKAIKAIINLPTNIFTGTSVQQAVIILTKGVANEYVIFADASGYTRYAKSVYRQTAFDWEQFLRDMQDDVEDYWDRGSYMVEDCVSVPLPYDQIKDYDLTPSKYLVPVPEDGVQLSEVAVEVSELRGKEATANYFITGSSIPASTHRKPFVPSKAGAEKIATAKNHVQLPAEAVIIAIVNGEIRTVYTEGFTEKIAFPGGFIKVLKPAEGVSAKYLAAILSTKMVSDQIKAHCLGTVIPRLNRMDLSNIILPRFDTPEDREKLIATVISSEMSELESELQNAYDTQKREIRSTRHAMIQTISALSSNWEQLKMFSELKGGKIDLTDVIGRINPISVERLMDSIGHAISTLERQVKALRFEKTDWGAEEAINPYAFINEYIAKHSTPSVRMENKGKDNVADFPYFDDEGDAKFHHTDAAEVFYAPVKLLERIFNNIVANAKAHGFTPDRTDNEIRFDWMSDDGNIVITIANNGEPLKQGVTGNDVLMSGFSTALNKDAENGTLHSGQGGFEIKSLMEGLGSVEVISEPAADFPVIYKLTFEKTNFETIDLED